MEEDANETVPGEDHVMERDPVIFYVEGVGISAVGAAGMALNALAVVVLARQGRRFRQRPGKADRLKQFEHLTGTNCCFCFLS